MGTSSCDIKIRRVCPHSSRLGDGFVISSEDKSHKEWICPNCDNKVEI